MDGHKTKAAGLVGIRLKTLHNRLHTYGYPLGSAVGEDEAALRPA